MKPEKFAIVFDWDDVVFNTVAFKANLAAALSRHGIPRAVVLDTVSIAKDKRGYNPRVHARMISERTSFKGVRRMEQEIWKACRGLSKKLLFPDAVRLILKSSEEKVPLYILSAGRRRFQEAKIEGSDLKPLFEGTYIVDVTDLDAAAATKIKVLKRLAKKHPKIIFLDDRIKNISAVASAPSLEGKVLPVLVWRKKNAPPKRLQAVRSLAWKEVRQIIAIHNSLEPY